MIKARQEGKVISFGLLEMLLLKTKQWGMTKSLSS